MVETISVTEEFPIFIPDLSFVVPVYNVQHYIQECMDSLMGIEGINFEVVIVNDGSTDRSIDNIRELLSLPNVRLINQENRGLSAARNVGILNARGNYIAFVDSDDKIVPETLYKLYKAGVERHNAPDIIVGDYNYWIGDKLVRGCHPSCDCMVVSGQDLLRRFYPKITSVVWRNIYRRNFLLNNELFFAEGIYFEDIEWMPRTFYCAKRVFYRNIAFYDYRCRLGSIMLSDFSKKKFEDCFNIAFMQLSFLQKRTDMSVALKTVFLRNILYCLYKGISSYPYAGKESDNENLKRLLPLARQNGNRKIRLLLLLFRHNPYVISGFLRTVRKLHQK